MFRTTIAAVLLFGHAAEAETLYTAAPQQLAARGLLNDSGLSAAPPYQWLDPDAAREYELFVCAEIWRLDRRRAGVCGGYDPLEAEDKEAPK